MKADAICFRAKRRDNGEWIKGYFCNGAFSGKPVIQNNEGEMHQIDIETLCQYSGLQDGEGEQIFDGDVIRHRNLLDDSLETFFIVKYGACGGVKNTDRDVGYMGFYFVPRTEYFGLRTDPIFWLQSGPCKVVGNIYDNHELLKIGE